MNETIKTILEKHLFTPDEFSKQLATALNSAIIEICEEQKNECANDIIHIGPFHNILNSKNIAK
jgi:hypothetical protein